MSTPRAIQTAVFKSGWSTKNIEFWYVLRLNSRKHFIEFWCVFVTLETILPQRGHCPSSLVTAVNRSSPKDRNSANTAARADSLFLDLSEEILALFCLNNEAPHTLSRLLSHENPCVGLVLTRRIDTTPCCANSVLGTIYFVLMIDDQSPSSAISPNPND